jgi:hypothetical protein
MDQDLMESTGGQLLMALLLLVGFFLAITAGVAVLLWMPLTAPRFARRSRTRPSRVTALLSA